MIGDWYVSCVSCMLNHSLQNKKEKLRKQQLHREGNRQGGKYRKKWSQSKSSSSARSWFEGTQKEGIHLLFCHKWGGDHGTSLLPSPLQSLPIPLISLLCFTALVLNKLNLHLHTYKAFASANQPFKRAIGKYRTWSLEKAYGCQHDSVGTFLERERKKSAFKTGAEMHIASSWSSHCDLVLCP